MKAAKAKAEQKVREQGEMQQRRKVEARSEARRATEEERPTHYCPRTTFSLYCPSLLPLTTASYYCHLLRPHAAPPYCPYYCILLLGTMLVLLPLTTARLLSLPSL